MLTKMSQKGVAVPYIIAIVLGIVVIGLVGYWLFISGGRFGTTSTQTDCNGKLLSWCTKRLTDANLAWSDDSCNTVLGITGATPAAEATSAQLKCPGVGVIFPAR